MKDKLGKEIKFLDAKESRTGFSSAVCLRCKVVKRELEGIIFKEEISCKNSEPLADKEILIPILLSHLCKWKERKNLGHLVDC